MAKRKTAKAEKGEALLIELLTEELPPKSLKRLSEAFAAGVFDGLKEKHFIGERSKAEAFATPRRLAVRVSGVLARQPDRVVERKGPSLQAGVAANGEPTQALLGFARSCGTDVNKLDRRKDDKGEYFLFSAAQKGELLAAHLSVIIEAALKKLPVTKLMRWGALDVQFVRPVHRFIALHGARVVPCQVLGLASGNKTLGHRFLGKAVIVLRGAAEYEKALDQDGQVIASFEKRRAAIVKALDNAAAKFGKQATWHLGKDADLVDEVTSIVEHPRVYAGAFDETFLDAPRECLIVSMQQHQRYFPIADSHGKLQPRFLFVANMDPADASQIIRGNERVLRARLSDAKFFYDQDRKHKLDERVPRLADVVYHNKLGTQLERVQRLRILAGRIARLLGTDAVAAERAAYLCKADLLTDMVGEFPELQGVIGRYYALHDGESAAIADAIEQHYFPRTAGGPLPQGPIAASVALADKLDTLAGMFGIGQQPTGEKDPFGLRRAALGIVRILIERELPLDLGQLVNFAFDGYGGKIGHAHTDVELFILERLRGYCTESGYSANEVAAVLSMGPVGQLHLVPERLKAVRRYSTLPEAPSLSAANKRIANILKKLDSQPFGFDSMLLIEPAEKQLASEYLRVEPEIEKLLEQRDFTGMLQRLASLKEPVDVFFDKVLVMADDARLRDNRLGLLNKLHKLMNRIADLSKLAAEERTK